MKEKKRLLPWFIIAIMIGTGFGIVFQISAEGGSISVNEGNSPLVFYPTADNSIHQHSPDNNYGTSGSLLVSNRYGYTSDYEADALLKFDLSLIPSGTTISSASLKLYYYRYDDTNPVGRAISCYKITTDWDEYSSTWHNRPSHTSAVTSYATLPSHTGCWITWDVTSDVQDFVNGTKTNYGWWIMDENYWGTYNIPQQYYKSRESGVSFKPYLEVEIDSPSISLIEPRGHLYFGDREIISLPGDKTIVLGAITVKAQTASELGIEKVEFYVDNELKETLTEEPYQWLWDETAFSTHTIKVTAYDIITGNTATDEQTVWIFNL